DKFDAANFFENAGGIPKGEFRQNQFGGSIGGPVVIPHLYHGKDKTFFFFDYEGTRTRQAVPYTSTVPTALERSSGYTNLSELLTQGGTQTDVLGRSTPLGQVFEPSTTRAVFCGTADPVTGLTPTSGPDSACPTGTPPGTQAGFVREPFPGNIIPAARLDPNAIALLNLFPAPNNPSLFSNFASNPVLRVNANQFNARGDQAIGVTDTYKHLVLGTDGLIAARIKLVGVDSQDGITREIGEQAGVVRRGKQIEQGDGVGIKAGCRNVISREGFASGVPVGQALSGPLVGVSPVTGSAVPQKTARVVEGSKTWPSGVLRPSTSVCVPPCVSSSERLV